MAKEHSKELDLKVSIQAFIWRIGSPNPPYMWLALKGRLFAGFKLLLGGYTLAKTGPLIPITRPLKIGEESTQSGTPPPTRPPP